MPGCLGGRIRKISFAFCVLGGFLFLTGCATSPYMMDRARDAGDIVTLTTGLGWGAKARTGPIQAGVFVNMDGWGWRNGRYEIPPGEHWFDIFDAVFLGLGVDNFNKSPDPRGKGFWANSIFVSILGKDTKVPNHPIFHPYYSQFEVCGALLGSLRVGVNPGEFVDFLLGWVGIDFFDDDIGLPKADSEEREHSSLNPNAPFYNQYAGHK